MIVPLSQVAEMNPKTDLPEDIAQDAMLDFLPMADVSESGVVSVTTQRPISEVQKGFTSFRKGDVLIAKITPCFENNKIAVADIATAVGFGSTEFHVVRCQKSRLDSRYLLHFLRTNDVRAEGKKRMTGSAGQQRVPKKFLEDLQIPLPPLEEQKRIAAILDQADELRRKRQRALDRLNQLGQAIFIEMFGDPRRGANGWEVLPFAEACEDQTSHSAKLQRGEYLVSGAFPVVDQGQSAIAGYCNDPAMLCRSVGPVVVFGDHTRAVKYVDFPFVIGADGAKILVPSRRFKPIFFAGLLSLMPVPDLGYSRHMREVKRLLFSCPPIELQEEYSRKMAWLSEVINNVTDSHAQMVKLFSSLQNRVFACDLPPSNPRDAAA